VLCAPELAGNDAYSWLTQDQPRLTADEAVDMLARFILSGVMGPAAPPDA
jgi:hypothetical protein